MNCKQIQDKLIFFIDGDLLPIESENIKLHLQSCKECQYLYNQLKASFEFLKNDKQENVNPFFITRLMERMTQESIRNSIFNWFNIKKYSIRVSIYSILAAFAIFVGYYLGKDSSTVEPDLVSKDIVITDNQLFANSYHIQDNEDLYLINADDNTK